MTVQQIKNFRHNVRILAYCKGLTIKDIAEKANLNIYGGSRNKLDAVIHSHRTDVEQKEVKEIARILECDHSDLLNRIVQVGFFDDPDLPLARPKIHKKINRPSNGESGKA